MNKDEQEELDEIEEELKEEESEEEKTHHKVSGKSVFELQEIIKEKSKKDGDGTSSKAVEENV
jgi:hypothetical protein